MKNETFKQILVDVFHDTKLHDRTQWIVVSAVLTFTVAAWVALCIA